MWINNSPADHWIRGASAEAAALVLPQDLLLVELDADHLVLLRQGNYCIARGVLPRSLRKAFLMVKGSFTVVST